MTIFEYKSEIIVVDMGVLFAGEDYPGVNYMIPDIKYLEDNRDKVKAICFTHAHLDHIGACRHLLPKFNPLTPIYGTDFTIGMIKKQMSELDDVPDLNYQVVDPFKHEKIKVSEHFSVEFIHTLHSIPGNAAIVVRTPNGLIYLSGDWRHEERPMSTQTDYERIDEIDHAVRLRGICGKACIDTVKRDIHGFPFLCKDRQILRAGITVIIRETCLSRQDRSRKRTHLDPHR